MSIASPIQWPDGWPRHRGERAHWPRQQSLSLSRCIDELSDELDRLGAANVSISMTLRSGTLSRQPMRASDPGIAIYFRRRGADFAMAQDRFETQAGNARSLMHAIKAMRSLERHGGGVIADRAFEGFTGVPAVRAGEVAASRRWWDVLGVSPTASVTAVRGAWRAMSAEAQHAGDLERAAQINAAWAEAKRDLKVGEGAA